MKREAQLLRSRLIWTCVLWAAVACTDDGWVGEAPAEVGAPQDPPMTADASMVGAPTDCPEPCGDEQCHPVLHECVECMQDADCAEADAPLCNTEDFECVGCRSDADCTGQEDGPFCYEDRCAECAEDIQCDPLERCEDGQCELEVEGESSGEGP